MARCLGFALSSWQEAITASTIAEWTNDDRLLGDIGGGNCTRLYRIWKRDLNSSDSQMPNFTAHSKAVVKHSDMFTDVLAKYVEQEGSKTLSRRQKNRWISIALTLAEWLTPCPGSEERETVKRTGRDIRLRDELAEVESTWSLRE